MSETTIDGKGFAKKTRLALIVGAVGGLESFELSKSTVGGRADSMTATLGATIGTVTDADMTDSRDMIANAGATLDNPAQLVFTRNHVDIFLPYDTAVPSNLINGLSLPMYDKLYAVVTPLGDTVSARLHHSQKTRSCDVTDQSGYNMKLVPPATIAPRIEVIKEALRPTTFGSVSTGTSTRLDINDPTVTAQTGRQTTFRMFDPVGFRSSPEVLDAAQRAAAEMVWPASETGEWQSMDTPGFEATRSTYWRHLTVPVAAAVKKELDVYVCQVGESGAVFEYATESQVLANEKALLEAMATQERGWLEALQKQMRDGGIDGEWVTTNIVPSPAMASNMVREEFRQKIAAWILAWQDAATASYSPDLTQARQDASWDLFKKTHPDSTATREEFDANPAALLTDADVEPKLAEDNASWWDRSLKALGWLGTSVIKPLADAGAVPTLAAVAGGALLGSNIPWTPILIGVGLFLLLK